MPAQTTKQPIIPLSGTKLGITALVLGLASFMAVVDITIANVSIPTIAGNLGVSSEEGEWAITLFAIANAICIPLTGWLSRRFGQVRLFLFAVAAFTVASALCGLSPSFDTLLASRILQGAVAGPIVPLSQALLVAIFPPEKRTLAVSIWAMVNMAGPVVGPLLGGWITDDYSWPWIFLVNVPVGVLVVFGVRMLLRGQDTPATKLTVDKWGLVFLAVAVGCLQLACDRGRLLDWFSSPFICIMLSLSVVSFCTLVVWELKSPHPIIDLRLFEYRNFTVGTIITAMGFGIYFSSLVLIPLWLQTNMGYTSTWAGIVTSPLGVFGVLLSPFMGRWVARGDARVFASIAFILCGAVSWWRSLQTTAIPADEIALMHLILGIGAAFFLTSVVSLSLTGMPTEKVAAATGLQTAIRMMSASLFASLAQTFWDQRARFHQNHLIDTLNPSSEHIISTLNSLRHAGYSDLQAWELINRQVDIQAHMLSLNDFFTFSTFLFALGLGIIWFAHVPKKINAV